MSQVKEESREARLQRLRNERDAREAARQELLDDIEADMLEAQAKAERETGDTVGAVLTEFGFVLVKRPEEPTFKKFMRIEKPTEVDYENLLRPCLLTPLEDYERIRASVPYVIVKTANMVCVLGGVDRADREKK